MKNQCENCWYNQFDEEYEEYYCDLQLDEDEFAKMVMSKDSNCKYFRPDIGEYGIVRKQN